MHYRAKVRRDNLRPIATATRLAASHRRPRRRPYPLRDVRVRGAGAGGSNPWSDSLAGAIAARRGHTVALEGRPVTPVPTLGISGEVRWQLSDTVGRLWPIGRVIGPSRKKV